MKRIFTTEHRRKLSESHKGKEPWNKGKSGVQIYSEETRKKMSESLKGKPSWAKGKKFSAKHRMKMSQSAKKRKTGYYNYLSTPEIRKMRSNALKKYWERKRLMKI